MNRHVNAIVGRLSLRPPQRHSLEILDRITKIASPGKTANVASALAAIRSEFPTAVDFEREFPSICFSLATGVGKTRLMGAFVSYLHLAHGINNFYVLAPNLTIYNKLIADFTPGSPKYVLKGIAEFATEAPDLITGDNYEEKAGSLFDQVLRCKINIFNISKINSEVRGGKSPRIKRLSEYIGESYFDYLAALPDLVLLMVPTRQRLHGDERRQAVALRADSAHRHCRESDSRIAGEGVREVITSPTTVCGRDYESLQIGKPDDGVMTCPPKFRSPRFQNHGGTQ